MSRRLLAQLAVILAVTGVVAVGLVAEFRLRGAPSRSQQAERARADVRPAPGQAPKDIAEASQPIYGPPSPAPPIYGPPSPPSRVPLFDATRRFNAPVLNVTDEDLRPDSSREPPRLTPVGWDKLDLDRGIPFRDAAPVSGRAPDTQADARHTLFAQSAADPPPVSVVYCLDPAIGTGAPEMLDQVRSRIKAAVSGLRSGDRIGAVALDAGGTPLIEGWHGVPPANAAWAKLDAVQSEEIAPMHVGLAHALAMQGATHVIVIASGVGGLTEDEAASIGGITGKRGSEARARIVALAVGDGAFAPRAGALRGLATATGGAFAWLRPVSARAPTDRPTPPVAR